MHGRSLLTYTGRKTQPAYQQNLSQEGQYVKGAFNNLEQNLLTSPTWGMQEIWMDAVLKLVSWFLLGADRFQAHQETVQSYNQTRAANPC